MCEYGNYEKVLSFGRTCFYTKCELMYACIGGYEKIAEHIIKIYEEMNVSYKTDLNWNLNIACQRGHSKIVKLIIEKDATGRICRGGDVYSNICVPLFRKGAAEPEA